MMTDWYDRSIKALQLNGMGERTQQAYTRSVRMLTEFYDRTPDCILRGGTCRLFPSQKKCQQVVSQYNAYLLLRDSLFLRECD